MEVNSKHHHGTLRLLLGIVALIVVGVAMYLILESGSMQSANQAVSPSVPAATSSPAHPITSTLTATSTQTTQPSKPTGTSPSTNEVVITNADMGKTIQVAKGDKIVVQLGGGLHWTVQFDPASAVTQIVGSSTNGIQGIYRADHTGTVKLSATGAPICKPDQACPMFLAEFLATILVK